VIYRRSSGRPPRLLLGIAVTAGVGAIVGGVACSKHQCMGLCAGDDDESSSDGGVSNFGDDDDAGDAHDARVPVSPPPAPDAGPGPITGHPMGIIVMPLDASVDHEVDGSDDAARAAPIDAASDAPNESDATPIDGSQATFDAGGSGT
jgi:hypothetical protein